MISFPSAKINLGLKIINKRTDGYHDIETMFYPIPLCDILEIVENESSEPNNVTHLQGDKTLEQAFSLKSGRKLYFSASGLAVDSEVSTNLCVKACELFDKQFSLPFDISMHLHKIIPMGAGLGGGSSDAASVLKMLNVLSHKNVDDDTLVQMAGLLGSDCAFFIKNTPAFATGRGEILNKYSIDLSGYKLILVKPDVHISTADAYAGVNPKNVKGLIQQCMNTSIENWKNCLKNDFEETVFVRFPLLAEIKNKMYASGAVYASMSGSGSSVFGLFNHDFKVNTDFKSTYYFEADL